MRIILEKIQKFFWKKNELFLTINRAKLEEDQLDADTEIVYPDGIISVNPNAYAISYVDQYGVFVSNVVDVNNYVNLIKKYEIVNQDLFVGREENYIIFRTNLSLQIKNNSTILDTQTIIINGLEFTVNNGKFFINGKEVAVVGGDINPSTNKIINSGQ